MALPLNTLRHPRLSKKYRKLQRWNLRLQQIYGPPTEQLWGVDLWSDRLGGYFTRHGNRRYATAVVQRLLETLRQQLQRLRRSLWLLPLETQSHERPSFLYGHLRQRFPLRSPEAERRWIQRLRQRVLRQSTTGSQNRGSSPTKMAEATEGLLLQRGSHRQLPLELAHHDQLALHWEDPQQLLGTPQQLPLLPHLWQEQHRRWRPAPFGGAETAAAVPAATALSPAVTTVPAPEPAGRRRRQRQLAALEEPLRRPLRRLWRQLEQSRRHRLRLPWSSLRRLRPFGRPARRRRAALRRRRAAATKAAPKALRPAGNKGKVAQKHSGGGAGGRRRPAAAAPTGRSPAAKTPVLRRRRWWREALVRRRRSTARRRHPRRPKPQPVAAGRRRTGKSRRKPVVVGRWKKRSRVRVTAVYGRYWRRWLRRVLRRRQRCLSPAQLERRWRRRLQSSAHPLFRRWRQLLTTPALQQRWLQRCRRWEQQRWRQGQRRLGRRRQPLTAAINQGRRRPRRRQRRNPWRGSRWSRRRRGLFFWRSLRRQLRHRGRSRWQQLRPPRRGRRSPHRRRPRRSGRRQLLRRSRRRPLLRTAEPLPEDLRLTVKGWTTLQTPQPAPLHFYYSQRGPQRSGRWRSAGGGCRGHRPLRLKRRAHRPVVHYRVLEISLVDLTLLEETGLEPAPERWLLLERRYGAVGYRRVLEDLWGLLTPAVRLLSQVVGHKSSRRTVYRLKGGVTLAERRRVVFGWLRDLVNKNPDYNHLRRNTARKPASKKVLLRPLRSRRLTEPFGPRLGAELSMVLTPEEPLLERLEDFDAKAHPLRLSRRHYRWST